MGSSTRSSGTAVSRFAARSRSVRGSPCRRSSGSAAVELALALPLALWMALALVQVGLLAKDSLIVGQSAREGAREAAVTGDEERVRKAVLRSGLPEDRTAVAILRQGGVGEPVTVEVSFTAPVVVPFVGWLFPEEVEVRASATMRQETTGEESVEGP